VPLALVVIFACRHVPESTDPTISGRLDVPGAALGTVGLAAGTYALIEGRSGSAAVIIIAAAIGVAGLGGFVIVERRQRHPMLPLDIFASRQFTAANLVTLAMYAALGGVFFLLSVDLQQVLRYSPVSAGGALFPVTLIMLLLSSRAGALSQRIGPRLPMTLGPGIVAASLLLMRGIGPGARYVTDILPAVVVFGLGLSLTVAPLTATVLAAADARHAGVASGVNNAIARVGSLLAVALLPTLAGLNGSDYRHPAAFSNGFHVAATICAGLCVVAALIAFAGIRNEEHTARVGAVDASARASACCPIDGPPIRRLAAEAAPN
jgi:hypothetical protein